MLFKRKITNTLVKEIKLENSYEFMYNVFLLTTPNTLYLFLEEHNDIIDTIKFNFILYKFGYPNDEAIGSHPMAKYGLKLYGIFEVQNSPWVAEIRTANRIHPRHSDDMYDNLKHFIVSYKDTTLDVLSETFELTTFKRQDLNQILSTEISFLRNQAE